MKAERFDIYQHITNQIIAAIESGAGEFRLPWHRSAGNIMRPINIASRDAYRGVNVLTLSSDMSPKTCRTRSIASIMSVRRGARRLAVIRKRARRNLRSICAASCAGCRAS